MIIDLAAITPLRPRPNILRCSTEDALEVLDAHMKLVAALIERAVAEGWDRGRISQPHTELPFEREVRGLLGRVSNAAPKQVKEADERIQEASAHLKARFAALGDRVPPVGTLAMEFGLSPLAISILMVTAAPLIWGELARVYAIVRNDGDRPLVDELLLFDLLGRNPGGVGRHLIARELERDAPLIKNGLLRTDGKMRPFQALQVDHLVVRMLRGEPIDPGLGDICTVVENVRRVDELILPGVLEPMLTRLPEARRPLRLVVRGAIGSGRRTLLACLAGLANRKLGVIDVRRLPTEPIALLMILGEELRRATLRGYIACVSGIDELPHTEVAFKDKLRDLLETHPAPLALRLGGQAAVPLLPGYVQVDIPPIPEAMRSSVWRDALARRRLENVDIDRLASRYRIGVGVIERVVAETAGQQGDLTDAIDRSIRQHIETRLGSVATKVTRLASFENVILPDEVRDSLKELVGRVRHRRRVFETWGFEHTISTSRGITALFQGGPGTGKTLVAGAIARELELDLYRIDLSRVMSKWIGETEQNLAAVFDAAEDGQAVILFDEADSLFTKRTEVKSSVDKYANLEVNFLLQRLDSFDGIAILTTNFGTAIDAAFKRRLSFRITFPFPDESEREQLWRVHLPKDVPTAGKLDLMKIAGKYKLSGGYIRNAALRAAFLAAAENLPMSQRHLERAVELEFNDVGKIAQSGILE
jgi:hypothetical protein